MPKTSVTLKARSIRIHPQSRIRPALQEAWCPFFLSSPQAWSPTARTSRPPWWSWPTPRPLHRHPPSVGARCARCDRGLVHRGGSSPHRQPPRHLRRRRPPARRQRAHPAVRDPCRGLAQRPGPVRRRRHRSRTQRPRGRCEGLRRHRHPQQRRASQPTWRRAHRRRRPYPPPPPGAPSHPGGYRELSGREVEVLRLVAEGQSNKAIGVSMGLSALTVKSHLARIARKLGTGDRAGMVAVALRTGIIH